MDTPSRIKDVYIGLSDYRFCHNASHPDPETNKDLFVGRDKVKERLKMLLDNTENASGAYLVAGYRGMGKTSLVKRAITELNNQSMGLSVSEKKFKDLDISLSQDNLKDQDVLRLMVRQLFRAWQEIMPESFDEGYMKIARQLSLLINNQDYDIKKSSSGVVLRKEPLQRKMFRDSLTDELTRSAFQPKEIEKELIIILDKIDELRRKNSYSQQIPQFVFIVDELDKIEPHYLYDHTKKSNSDDDDVFGMNKVRGRQEEIARLLANLKSFLNTAKAKFIFIGGREMYDAALADIADRESFYSSIFHDVIYVPSFFKDKFTKRSGLTRLTEGYLCKVIIPVNYVESFIQIHRKAEGFAQEEWFDLKTVFHYLIDISIHANESSNWRFRDSQINDVNDLATKNAIYKTLILLQNFVIYLTYRSNGTPKKLVSLIEAFIASVNKDRLSNAINTHIIFLSPEVKNPVKQQLFLRFSYNQQYEIGLTANLYRPYAIIHSRYTKSLGDKLLYSTAYIIDYLLKFHPHAFSWRNLEMMPEIILINKDPNLRYYLEDVLKYLSGMYIRETVNSIFQYKFFNRSSNEIKLLTKISEPASAAFNFTLDESLQVKSYYRRRLKQLQISHPEHTHSFIHSISFVQAILADLHYFDKEYDEAIIYHSDAIQVLRYFVQSSPEKLTKHQVIKYVRHKLLLGLCLEKIKAFDSAYSIYRGLILNIPRLLDKVTNNDEAYYFEEDEDTTKVPHDTSENKEGGWDKPIRRMQLFIRPHIALLDVIEKQRMDGVTYANLLRNFRDVHDFLVEKTEESSKRIEFEIGASINDSDVKKNIKLDTNRVHTLLSDYYNHVGMLLFFKNRNFSELFNQFEKLGFKLKRLNYLKPEEREEVNIPSNEEEYLIQPLHNFRSSKLGDDKSTNKDYLPSLSALVYYLRALRETMHCYNKEIDAIYNAFSTSQGFRNYDKNNETDLSRAIFLLFPEAGGVVNATGFFTLGNLFSRIGDTLLASMPPSSSTEEFDISYDILMLYGDKTSDEVRDGSLISTILSKIHEMLKGKNEVDEFFTLDFILLLYRGAGYFYSKSGRNYSYAFQYKKFLYVIKDYVSFLTDEKTLCKKIEISKGKYVSLFQVIENCCTNVAERIFAINTWIIDVANRPQILKYREIFKGDSLPTFDAKDETRLIYLNLSSAPEIRETIALVEEIKLKIYHKIMIVDQINIPNVITSYDLISSHYSRITELRCQCTANFLKLEKMGYRWMVKSITSDLRILGLLKNDGTIESETMSIILNLEKGIDQNNVDYIFDFKLPSIPKEEIDSLRKATYFKSVINERILKYKYATRTNSDNEKILFKQYFGEFYFEEKLKRLIEFAMLSNETDKDSIGHVSIFEEINDLKKCICDTIFCLFETIRTLNLFGINYITNYSYIANAHYKLANWCQAYLNYDILIDRPLKKYRKKEGVSDQLLPDEIKTTLKKILQEEDLSFLEPNYHNEMAVQYYYASIQTHTGGKAYRNLNQSMSFLEDNFNDNLTHFCAATERFRMNSGIIRREIKKLKGKINHSSIYAYKNYLNHKND